MKGIGRVAPLPSGNRQAVTERLVLSQWAWELPAIATPRNVLWVLSRGSATRKGVLSPGVMLCSPTRRAVSALFLVCILVRRAQLLSAANYSPPLIPSLL